MVCFLRYLKLLKLPEIPETSVTVDDRPQLMIGTKTQLGRNVDLNALWGALWSAQA